MTYQKVGSWSKQMSILGIILGYFGNVRDPPVQEIRSGWQTTAEALDEEVSARTIWTPSNQKLTGY